MARRVPWGSISATSMRRDRNWTDGYSFGVLGPLAVGSPGGPVILPMGRERAVLAQLLVSVGRPVGVDALVDGLWPQTPPASADRTLHAHVARLRGRLDPERSAGRHGLIVTVGRGYLLDIDGEQVDAGRFEAHVDRAVRGDDESTDLQGALQLWRGRAYDGFDEVERCAQEGRRLDALRLAAIELRNDAALELGADVALVAALEELVVEHPLRERFWEQLMLGLYRVGRQSEALGAYKRARRTLIEEIGVEPGPALRHLEAAILDHDVGLLSPRRARPTRSVPLELEAEGTLCTGRDQELAAILTYWTAAADDQGGFVALLGPEGIGKTRLASEVAVRVQAQGAVVLYARCDQAKVGPRLLFDAALRSQGWSTDNIVDGPEGLAAGFAQQLGARRRERPVLIVFDDLHLADTKTLMALAELTEWCASMPVLMIGAFRADAGPAVSSRHIGLEGLDRQAVRTICQLYRTDGWTSEDVTEIFEATAGVPLHVHREAAAVAERDAIAQLDSDVERLATAQRSTSSSRTAATEAVLDLRRLLERRRRQSHTLHGLDRPVNPYRGLSRYDEHDADLFFGRDRLVAELMVRLASSDLLALVGPSGVGKSSVIRAGVLAALTSGVLPGSETWRRVVFTPGVDPLASLSAAVAELGPVGVRVLVVDQFEELFTLGQDAIVRRQVLDELDRLAGSAALKVVMVIRSDHVGSLGEHPALAARLADATVLVGPPTGAEIRDIVEGPAERSAMTVERALTDEVVTAAAGATGMLPLVSTALAATWERRDGNQLTLAGYDLSGRVAGAVARLAEDMWSSMSEEVQAAARRILLRLVRPDDGTGDETRLRAQLQDVAPLDRPAATDALRTLVDHRLLMIDGETVEITHDAVLRAWPRLAEWLAQDVDSRRLHHHVAAAAAWWADGGHDDADLLRGARLAAAVEWRDSGHAEELNDIETCYVDASVALSDQQLARAQQQAQRQRQANRRLRALVTAIALLLVFATVAGVVALRQADRADTQAAAADRAADRASDEAAAAIRQQERADAEAAAADAARQTADAEAAAADSARETADATALVADAERLGALSGLERDLDRSLLLAVQATDMASTVSTTGALLRAIQRSPRAVGMVRSEGARLLALELDPAGRVVAVNENLGGTTLYEVATHRRLGHFPTLGALSALAWSPDGTAFATVDRADPASVLDPFDVVVVDAATMTERARYTGRTDPVSDVAFSPDGLRLVAAPGDRGSGRTPELTIWDVPRPGPPARRVELPDATIRDFDQLSFGADGTQVAVSVTDATAIIELATGQRITTVEGSGGLFAPGGRTLAVNNGPGSLPLTLDLVDVASGQRRPLLGAHDERILHRAFSQDGTRLVTSADDRIVRVWDTATGRELYALAGHTGRVLASQFSPDGASLFSTGLDRTVITWDLDDRRTLERTLLPPSNDGVSAETMTLTSDETTFVAIGTRTALLGATDLASGRKSAVLDTGHSVADVVIPSGGTTVVTGGADGAVRRWDAATGALLAELIPTEPSAALFPLAVTSDGDTVYLQNSEHTLQAYDAVHVRGRPKYRRGPRRKDHRRRRLRRPSHTGRVDRRAALGQTRRRRHRPSPLC